VKILYFAWLRERLNRASDEVDPPPEVVTLADLKTQPSSNSRSTPISGPGIRR